MAAGVPGLFITMEAGQDLSAKQFYGVVMASDGQIDPAGAGVQINGFLQDDPAAAGRAALVQIAGTTKASAGAAITRGAKVMMNAEGQVITATATNFIVGFALSTASADNDIIEVLIQPGGVHP